MELNPAILNVLQGADTSNPIVKALLNAIGVEDFQIMTISAKALNKTKDQIAFYPRPFARTPDIIFGIGHLSCPKKNPEVLTHKTYFDFEALRTEKSFFPMDQDINLYGTSNVVIPPIIGSMAATFSRKKNGGTNMTDLQTQLLFGNPGLYNGNTTPIDQLKNVVTTYFAILLKENSVKPCTYSS